MGRLMLKIQKNCLGEQGASLELDVFMQTLYQALKTKASLFWRSKFLTHYIHEDINPWGLRIHIFLNIYRICHLLSEMHGN